MIQLDLTLPHPLIASLAALSRVSAVMVAWLLLRSAVRGAQEAARA